MIRIYGTITDPSGQAVPRAMIELRALNNSPDVLMGAVLTYQCDMSGRYNFTLGVGVYDVYAQNDYQSDMDYLGTGAVSARSVDGALSSMLVDGGITLTPPMLDSALDAMQQAVAAATSAATHREQAESAAQTVAQNAASASQSESEAKAARDRVLNEVADIRQRAALVDAATPVVQSNADKVQANTDVTRALAASVTTDAAAVAASASVVAHSVEVVTASQQAVETLRERVSSQVSTAVAAADTASQKALGAAQSEAVASRCATRAEQAAQVVAGALIDAGAYDASTGTLPVPIQVAGISRSCIWKVTGTGMAGGMALGVGDSLIYTTHSATYYKIDTTESVTRVNGQKGIVSLTATDVQADAAGTAATLMQQHEAKVGAHAIAGVSGLDAALSTKYSPNNKPTVAELGAEPVGSALSASRAAVATHEHQRGAHAIDGVAGLRSELDGKQPLSPLLTAVANATSGLGSHRNLLINSSFSINRRRDFDALTVAPGSNEYLCDRWRAFSEGSHGWFSHISDNEGATSGSRAYISLRGEQGNTALWLRQVVESVTCLFTAGSPLTLSVDIVTAFSTSVDLRIDALNTPDDVTATTRLSVHTFPLSVPATSSSVSQVVSHTFTANALCRHGLMVDIQVNGNPDGQFFAIRDVQLEIGPVATPFEHRHYALEAFLCRRYFHKIAMGSHGGAVSMQAAVDDLLSGMIDIGAPMRSVPHLRLFSDGVPDVIHDVANKQSAILTGAPTIVTHDLLGAGTLSGILAPGAVAGTTYNFDLELDADF